MSSYSRLNNKKWIFTIVLTSLIVPNLLNNITQTNLESNGQIGNARQNKPDIAYEQTIFGSLNVPSQDPYIQFDFYRNQVLHEFNLTLGDYYALPQDDFEQLNRVISALWGYENGTLSKEEAVALTITNSPRLFWGIWSNPTAESLSSHDTEDFCFSFSCTGSWWDVVVAVRAFVDTNPDLTTFSESSSTTHPLSLVEIWDFWNYGYISGTNWYASSNGIYIGWVDFNAVGSGLPAASWAKIVIETKYKAWDLFKGWDTPIQLMRFSYNQIGQKNINILQVEKPNPPPVIPPPVDSRKVLILIHGYGDDPTVFDNLYSSFTSQQVPQADRDYFQNTYKTTLYFTYLYSAYGHVKSIGEALKNFITTHCSGSDTIDIVAHSLGGIITRCFIKYYYETIPESQRPTIDFIITCGSPHQGIFSLMPLFEGGFWMGVDELVRFIIPLFFVETSSFIKDELNSPSDVPIVQKTYHPLDIKWYTLRGNNDFYGIGLSAITNNGLVGDEVVPTQACVLNDLPDDRNILIDGENHVGTISVLHIKAILGFPSYSLPAGASASAKMSVESVIPVTDQGVQFNGELSVGAGNNLINTYLWDFGDGTYSTEINPTHEYQVPGTYNTKLTVVDESGYSDTITQEITIEPSWTPSFASLTSPEIIDEGQSVTLDGSLSLNGASFRWDFGDGAQTDYISTPITSHTYSTPGRYVIKLQVYDYEGFYDEKRVFINVRNVAPTIILTDEYNVEVGQPTSITPIISDPGMDSEIFYTQWTISGQTYVAPSLELTFDQLETILVKIIVCDSFGGIATGSFLLNVRGDDDVLPPIIEIVSSPPIIYDASETFEISFIASDDSGISQVSIEMNDLTYPATFYDGCYHTILSTPMLLGSHDLKIKVLDGDNEYVGDALSSELSIAFLVLDDDETPPIVTFEYIGLTLNAYGGINVAFQLMATDPESGIDLASVDVWAGGQHFTTLGTHTITMQEFGSFTATTSIKNADLDRGAIDQEEGTATLEFNITADLVKGLVISGIAGFAALVANSNDISWRAVATNRKDAMGNKLAELQALVEASNYSEAYTNFLHDVKPKLTGLKQDEFGVPWGSGTFNNPWVVDASLQGTFAANIDTLLYALRWLAGGDPNPAGRLLANALLEIDSAQADIATVNCKLLRGILEWTVGKAETNLVKAWDLYGADQPDWAAVRVKVADCLLGISDLVVDIGNYFDAIDDETAASLGGHFASARTALTGVLAILDALA